MRARVNLQQVARARRHRVPVNRAMQHEESGRADNHFIRRVAKPIVERIGRNRAADVHAFAGNGVGVLYRQRLDIDEFNGIAERVGQPAVQVKVFGPCNHAAFVMPRFVRLARPVAVSQRVGEIDNQRVGGPGHIERLNHRAFEFAVNRRGKVFRHVPPLCPAPQCALRHASISNTPFPRFVAVAGASTVIIPFSSSETPGIASTSFATVA